MTFSNQKKLNGFTASANLLAIVDDTLAEGDETLVVEPHCTGSKSGTEPPHTELASSPLTLIIEDNDAVQTITLSASPEAIGETLGKQTVTVTATAESAPSAPVTVTLTLGAGHYTATGLRSIEIPAGATSGSTALHVTPSDDANATDDTVAIDGSAIGSAVSGADLTIEEPTLVGGVDLSGLGVTLAVSPTAIQEGASGTHAVTATLKGVDVPTVDVALVLAVGGTATEGSAHDYVLSGGADWRKLTVAANDAFLTASTSVAVSAMTDDEEEGDETVTFTASGVTWGTPVVAANAFSGGSRLDATWTRVTWVDGDGVAQPIAQYQYRHRPEGGAWTSEVGAYADDAETETMTRTIAGLASATWHEVQVRGVNHLEGAAHPGKWSEPGRGRTWGPPDQVGKPLAYLTDEAVEVVWEAPHDGGAAIDDYDVDYKGDSGGWTPHPYSGCGVGECVTEASVSAAAKKVRVRAENALGSGDWSPTAKVQAVKLLRASYGEASARVDEGQSLLVTVQLDRAADRAVTLPLTTTPASGPFRLDGAAGGAATVPLGAKEQTFTLAALQDDDGLDETVTLGFGDLPDAVMRIAPASLTVAIDDDEAVNRAPTFDEGASATRSVAEGTAAGGAVGAPVAATDPDGDAITYSLGGTDAAQFTIDSGTGQLRVAAGTARDYENGPRAYAVTVQASDGKDQTGAADAAADAAISVSIDVSDVAEPPSAMAAPALASAPTKLTVAWAEPANAGPEITGYDIRYKASDETDWTKKTVEAPAAEAKLKNLAPGTAYEVRVRAGNDEGTGAWSASAFANTLPRVTLTASDLAPVIGADNAAAEVTLTATVEAAGGGELEGEWLQRVHKRASKILEIVEVADGAEVSRTVSRTEPGQARYGV